MRMGTSLILPSSRFSQATVPVHPSILSPPTKHPSTTRTSNGDRSARSYSSILRVPNGAKRSNGGSPGTLQIGGVSNLKPCRVHRRVKGKGPVAVVESRRVRREARPTRRGWLPQVRLRQSSTSIGFRSMKLKGTSTRPSDNSENRWETTGVRSRIRNSVPSRTCTDSKMHTRTCFGPGMRALPASSRPIPRPILTLETSTPTPR